ncbi:hypothetical protein EV385_1931 [Krasilnikovia cinnamomea]|uniref:Uncharacterized protein n=1 Tax=Krasilnikovia cinnamomea TaxID=349313 RepID=A0A4V2G6V8_9ACTN|nr:hypothetical protein [Krasilnikovia cinnamomea]RZU50166.1 hypothetical protein EV385_1931 [Krasilnikovia cinnamomea]
MTPIVLQVALSVVLVILTAYAAGRVHEWYRHSREREAAYRDGYDEASHSLFRLATRTGSSGGAAQNRSRPADVVPIDAARPSRGDNREATTYRLRPIGTL